MRSGHVTCAGAENPNLVCSATDSASTARNRTNDVAPAILLQVRMFGAKSRHGT